ncbi:MAG TPA: diguanylate cyclase [Meiothermus sp.]|nr:diguanylate cyclase [Meiothermus sp.]
MGTPLSSTDPLTGALSRTLLRPTLEAALAEAQHGDNRVALLILDLDHFKSINDTFGHARGDLILQEFAQRAQGGIRGQDRLFRYGGDEFVLLLPATSREQATALAERLLQIIHSAPFGGNPPLSLTLSIGLALSEPGDTPEGLFDRADRHLYAAKRQGRGRLAEVGSSPAGEGRWLEREAAHLTLLHFLQVLPQYGRGLLQSEGARGAGHSRFLEQAEKTARMMGYRTIRLHGREAYATHAYGALLDGLGLADSDAAILGGARALRERLGSRPILWLVDEPEGLDVASRKILSELLTEPGGPAMGIAVVAGADWPSLPLFERVELAPLSLEATRIFLRTQLRWEPPEGFSEWFWGRSGGLPGRMMDLIHALETNAALIPRSRGYTLAPDYRERDETPGEARPPLPRPSHGLIGRDRELLEIKRLLTERRLVSLVAAGGMGKTRLAMQAALELEHRYRDGVHFVALASLDDPDQLPARLAQEFGLKTGGDPQAALIRHLQGRQVLLVLDNFEQLREGVEHLRHLLREAPGPTLLVTSRVRLGLPEEWVLPLAGLELSGPSPAGQNPAALRMLLQAIQRVNPGAQLSQSERSAAAAICELVEGLPLGLELAAAWTKVLSLEEIAEGIRQNLGFLESPAGEALPERHRSLRAVFESSWQLLNPDEQRVLARLAVFRGGFGRDGAASVGGASVSLLLGLVNLSLLQRDPQQPGRYQMHELLRQLAYERLGEAEREEALEAHARYFCRFAASAEPELKGAEQVRWIERVAGELDNLRTALATLERRGWAAEGQEMIARLRWFYYVRGLYREAAEWHQTFLAMPVETPAAVRSKAQRSLASLLKDLGQGRESLQLLEQSLETSRSIGDRDGLADALHLRGLLEREATNFQAALASFQESLELKQHSGDLWGQATSLNDIGIVFGLQNQFEQARAYFYQSLELKQQIGDEQGVAYALGNIALVTNDPEEEYRLLFESLAIKRRLKDRQGIATALANLGKRLGQDGRHQEALGYLAESLLSFRAMGQVLSLATVLGYSIRPLLETQNLETALRLAAAVERWERESASKFTPQARQNLLETIAETKAALGEAGERVWLEGQALSLDEACGLVSEMVRQ